MKPCNYLSLTRKDSSINGTFVIDPTLRIPPSLLPSLEEGESEGERKNLRLVSDYGVVDVEIYLVDGERDETSTPIPRTTLYAKADHGWVVVKLVSSR